jgi:predicted enzyme related to lactoylglutathione lyase
MSTEVVRHAPGTFCWVEMGTPYPEGSLTFYTALFSWTSRETAMPSGRPYTTLFHNDLAVAGLIYMNQPGVPPMWLSYIAVENVDETTYRAGQLGAGLMVAPLDVGETGRMSVLSDPDGSLFALWQAREHAGAQRFNQVGSFCWNELMARDVDRCQQFYSELLDWTAEPMTNYVLFKKDGKGVAGMMPLPASASRVPPHWLVYFAVDDCDLSFAEAQRLGAMVLMPPADIPSIGRFAVMQDPVGGVFAIIKLVS